MAESEIARKWESAPTWLKAMIMVAIGIVGFFLFLRPRKSQTTTPTLEPTQGPFYNVLFPGGTFPAPSAPPTAPPIAVGNPPAVAAPPTTTQLSWLDWVNQHLYQPGSGDMPNNWLAMFGTSWPPPGYGTTKVGNNNTGYTRILFKIGDKYDPNGGQFQFGPLPGPLPPWPAVNANASVFHSGALNAPASII